MNMKIKNLIYCLCIFSLFLVTISCRKKEVIADNIEIPGLGGTQEVPNELDEWLYNNYTKEYNVEVVYRWDIAQMQSSIISKLAPVRYDAVEPMMATLAKVWFKPFNETADAEFLKQMVPKKIVLVGSPEYSNGAIKLGQAEGGRKILLLNANKFDARDEYELKKALETIIHEFLHILHQTKLYDASFSSFSAGQYDPSGWQEINNTIAIQRGFASAYSMSGKDEDFVEILSLVLVRGVKWFKDEVLTLARQSKEYPQAEQVLLSKLKFVENYLMSAWSIAMFDDPITGKKGLETVMQEEVDKILTNSPVE